VRRLGAGRLALDLVLSLAALVFILPFAWMLFTSLKPETLIMGRPELLFPLRVTLEQYRKIFEAVPLPRFFLNSLVFAGGVTAASLFFDSLAGYAFAKLRFPGRGAAFVLVLATLMVPFQVTMVPLYLMMQRLHGLDTYWGLILPRLTNAFGIYMMRQAFLSVPDELLDAGRIDGLGEYAIFTRIARPLVTMTFVTLAVFHFMYNWNDFLWPLLVTNDTLMRTLPVGLALFMGEHVMEHGPIVAGAVVSVLPVLIFFLFARRTFIEGIATSGLKG
jgi:multiple sugar transport system permease protein